MKDELNKDEPHVSVAPRAQRGMPVTTHGIQSPLPRRRNPMNDTMESLLTEETAKSGLKVVHPKFGNGMIVGMTREANDTKLQILFDNYGIKTLLLSMAPLTIRD